MRSLAIVTLAAVFALPAFAATTRLSETAAGVGGDAASFSVKISDDGRFAVFQSTASNLVAGDLNAVNDVFLKDTQTGAISCMSCVGTTFGDGASTTPAISADGRFVTFASAATNLVAGDSNTVIDVFVRDVAAGTLELVSRAATSTGAIGNGASGQPRLSANGQFVAFGSTATNLVAGDSNAQADIFLRDRTAGTVTRISVATGGAQASGGVGGATNVAMSSDARYFVFVSGQQTLSAGDTNTLADAFFHDRIAVTTERLSTTAGTTGSCLDPAISGDGSLLAFSSSFTDLVTGDTNAARDTFFRARTGTALTRITLGATQANGALEVPSINNNGSAIAFQSDATNLVTGDTNTRTDVFTYAVSNGAIERISLDTAGVEATGGASTFPWFAGNGSAVAYSSGATNLVPNDTNATVDTFLSTIATTAPIVATTPSGPLSFILSASTATRTLNFTGGPGNVTCVVTPAGAPFSVPAGNITVPGSVVVTASAPGTGTLTCSSATVIATYALSASALVQVPSLNVLGLLALFVLMLSLGAFASRRYS
jgi:Tol biopolymer transport system component